MSYAATMTRNSGAFTFGIATWLCATFVATLRLASAQEPPKNFTFVDKPVPVAEITFDDAEGQARKLADFKGKVLFVNVWATWCGPCRTEMPALDRLQARLGGSDFEVISVSIDRGGTETIRKFYSEIGVRNLAMYIDPSGQVLRQTRALGLPTTLRAVGVKRENLDELARRALAYQPVKVNPRPITSAADVMEILGLAW